MNYYHTLSLIIPCYNEEDTIEPCVEKVLKISEKQDFNLELVIVNDASTDKSLEKINKLSEKHPEIKVLSHEKNMGKGAALRTGLTNATGDYIGIQDADEEYNPFEYSTLLDTMITKNADVVYGSRYLKPSNHRVLYFWHTWMNKKLTLVSNMFTNLDITDMETCYKLFKKEVIQEVAPKLKENRFGFEPEVTVRIAQGGYEVYECAISYNPRSYEEGKKIGWKDGVRALYCLFHYGADTSPYPMQILIYLFIGTVAAIVNMLAFYLLIQSGVETNISVLVAFVLSAFTNYILCILILFQHRARWNTFGEILMYLLTITLMGGFDFGVVFGLTYLSVGLFKAKFWAIILGFIGNFVLRRWLVFPSKRKIKK